LTEVKLPRRIAWRVMIEKKISTMLSQDPEVGVKCKGDPGVLSQPGADVGVGVRAVVVAHDVQRRPWVGDRTRGRRIDLRPLSAWRARAGRAPQRRARRRSAPAAPRSGATLDPVRHNSAAQRTSGYARTCPDVALTLDSRRWPLRPEANARCGLAPLLPCLTCHVPSVDVHLRPLVFVAVVTQLVTHPPGPQ
jgi:hypothetical protein